MCSFIGSSLVTHSEFSPDCPFRSELSTTQSPLIRVFFRCCEGCSWVHRSSCSLGSNTKHLAPPFFTDAPILVPVVDTDSSVPFSTRIHYYSSLKIHILTLECQSLAYYPLPPVAKLAPPSRYSKYIPVNPRFCWLDLAWPTSDQTSVAKFITH